MPNPIILAWKRARLARRTSRFTKAWEAYRAGFYDGKGFYLGDHWRGWSVVRPVHVPGVASIITVGGAGRRKGSGLVIPNVLAYSHQVCFDFSGEIASVTKKRLESKGYKVVCVNPQGLHQADPQNLGNVQFNPLAGIDPTSRRFASQCRARAEACINRSGRESDPHWANSAVAVIDFFSRNRITREHKAERTANLVDVITDITGAEQKSTLARMVASPDKFIASEGAAMQRRAEKSPKEFEGVVSSITSNLAWLKDAAFEASMSGHGIDYKELAGRGKHEGYVVFIILPLELADSHAAWLRLCLDAIIAEMIRRRPKHRILFTVDEAAVLGGWVKIKHALANLRKFKMQFHLIYHSLGDLHSLFGDSYHSMMANCFVKNFVGVNDAFTAEALSKLLGETETFDNEGKIERIAVARAEDIMQLSDDAQISLIGGGRPLFISNRPYFHRPMMRRGLNQNPYYEAGEYPNIPPMYPIWYAKGLALTYVAMMRPILSEVLLALTIAGGALWAVLH